MPPEQEPFFTYEPPHRAAPVLSRRLAAAALTGFLALAGCGAPAASPGTSASPQSILPPRDGAQSAVRAVATAAPGETAMGLPGETAMGMPGAAFACTGLPETGAAACTLAIALNVAANANPSEPARLIPGLHPADVQAAYGLPSGAGGTVAVVDAYDAPSVESDLAVYRAAFGLPACTSANGCFTKLNQSGVAASYPAASSSWAQETALDVEMVSAACPRCKIVLVEASSAAMSDLAAAVEAAAARHPRAISNSYYAIEWAGERALDVHFDHPGVAITAAAGDRGYPAYPATSPYVTAVGGTTLRDGSTGWSNGGWKYGGHGCSGYEPVPAFQTGLGVCRTRAAVDLAAVGDPETGVATYSAAAGGWVVAGGTSVGAPLVAAAYALAPVVEPLSYTYAHRSLLRKVGTATYAFETGLGVPNGVAAL